MDLFFEEESLSGSMSVGSLKFATCSALPGGCVASPSGAFFRGEPDERGRATRSFRSKRADTIAAGPLDSTQATRAAHAAQSGCAATGPLTGRRGGRGLTGGYCELTRRATRAAPGAAMRPPGQQTRSQPPARERLGGVRDFRLLS